MRSSLWIAAVLGCSMIGCKGEPFLPDAQIDSPIDAYEPPWLQPKPAELGNWDVQLVAPFDLSIQRDLYILDLWAVATAGTITYDDNSTVTVSAGPLSGSIDMLHGKGTKVACFVRAGAVNLAVDPDAMKFPGYEANPPDDPTPPAAGSVIGWTSSGGDPVERWLDISAAGSAQVLPLVEKRIAYAASIGCDAVVFARIDRYVNDGFVEPSFSDQVAFHKANADAAHAKKLGATARNSYTNGFSSALAEDYDFAYVERCSEFDDCEMLRPYPDKFKAIFAVEYSSAPAEVCAQLENMGVMDGLIKRDALDGSYAEPCNPE